MNISRDYLEELEKKNRQSKMEDEAKIVSKKNYVNLVETFSTTFY